MSKATRTRVERLLCAKKDEIRVLKSKLKQQEKEGQGLKNSELRKAYTRGTRANINYLEGVVANLEKKVHPVVSKELFLEYKAFRDEGSQNALMIGVLHPERFNRDVMSAIMKDYALLESVYC